MTIEVTSGKAGTMFYHVTRTMDEPDNPKMRYLLDRIVDGTADADMWNKYIYRDEEDVYMILSQLSIAFHHAKHFHVDLATGRWIE